MVYFEFIQHFSQKIFEEIKKYPRIKIYIYYNLKNRNGYNSRKFLENFEKIIQNLVNIIMSINNNRNFSEIFKRNFPFSVEIDKRIGNNLNKF